MRGIYTIFTVFWRRRVHPVSGWYVLSGDRLCRILGNEDRTIAAVGSVRSGPDGTRIALVWTCFRMHFPQVPKTKKPYISLIHKVSFFLLPFLSKVSERKTGLSPVFSIRYVSVCYDEFSVLGSLTRSVRFTPQCISMLHYKDTINNRNIQRAN